MGNRLSKIATRTGDQGTTGLGNNTRVDKDHARIQTMGDIDELNSQIGVLLTEVLSEDLQKILLSIQHDLFDLGGELSIPEYQLIKEVQVLQLDQWLEFYNHELPPLKDFILPGGTKAAALAHVCRTVCRRAERSLVTLAKAENIHNEARQYLNRLSDLLFVLSRVLNRVDTNKPPQDILWQRSSLQ